MKQLLILSRNLAIKQILAVDDIIPVQDIISPQKTTFEVPINKEIVIGDLIILKNEELFEYFGVVQDIENDKTTKLAGYPLINITDGEYQLSTLNGDVYEWIVNAFTKNFINTDDELLKLPFTFRNNTTVTNLKLDLQDGNLFDALLTIFKKTGIYIRFSLGYENGKAVNIVCNVDKADENTKITIRYDNPIVFERPAIELSQAQNTNKIIFKPADNTAGAQIYTFYLLDNNTVTTNANASGRINGVVQSIQTYTKDNNTVEKLKEKAEEIMLGDTLNHQITLKVINNLSYNFQLYDKVEYIDEKMQNGKNRVFETYVTRIENNNEIYKVLRLGVLRTKLTDKVKALEKAVVSKTTSGGNVSGGSVNVDLSNYYNKTQINSLLEQKANKNEIPDVSAFVTKAVSDLENYYTKSQTYTQEEVNNLVSAIPKFKIEVVTSLPTSNINETTIYLLKTSTTETGNLYTEYIYTNGAWESLGTQTLDLSGYVTETELANKGYATTSALNSGLARKANQSALNNCVKYDDIEDGTGSTSTRKALSANQGRILNNYIQQMWAKLPDEYIKKATVSDNLLILTNQDDENVTFGGGGSGQIVLRRWS